MKKIILIVIVTIAAFGLALANFTVGNPNEDDFSSDRLYHDAQGDQAGVGCMIAMAWLVSLGLIAGKGKWPAE
jgi:hypothetical protein